MKNTRSWTSMRMWLTTSLDFFIFSYFQNDNRVENNRREPLWNSNPKVNPYGWRHKKEAGNFFVATISRTATTWMTPQRSRVWGTRKEKQNPRANDEPMNKKYRHHKAKNHSQEKSVSCPCEGRSNDPRPIPKNQDRKGTGQETNQDRPWSRNANPLSRTFSIFYTFDIASQWLDWKQTCYFCNRNSQESILFFERKLAWNSLPSIYDCQGMHYISQEKKRGKKYTISADVWNISTTKNF